ncbi:MAG: PAS domain-containing protein [Hyphomicrobium sp.]
MRHPVSKALYAYWNDVRGDRLAPKRFDIEPSRLGGVLPDTFVLERVTGDSCRFRLAGTRISEAFSCEFRGMNVFELFGDEDRITLQRQISVVSRQGAVGLFLLGAETDTGLAARFEMLLLPLTHTRDVVDRFLGSIAPIQRPDWLGVTPIGKPQILENELIWPDGRPHAMIDTMGRQSPFLPQQREGRLVRSERRQFRVYDGGLSRDDE